MVTTTNFDLSINRRFGQFKIGRKSPIIKSMRDVNISNVTSVSNINFKLRVHKWVEKNENENTRNHSEKVTLVF